MSKELIDQIKKLNGVKTVEIYEGNSLVVTFEPDVLFVQCNTKEEYDFLLPHIWNPDVKSEWEDFAKHPVWIHDKGITTIIPKGGTIIDSYEYMIPDLIESFHEYMINEAEKRFPDGCSVCCPDGVIHTDIRKPFRYGIECIMDSQRKIVWDENDGWARIICLNS